jgi:hypothetical protein
MKTKSPHMPALTRTFAGLDRCQQHRGELLTRDGTCPRCERRASGVASWLTVRYPNGHPASNCMPSPTCTRASGGQRAVREPMFWANVALAVL